ncbi:MAG: putative 13 [Rickettsiales bacterium]|jgi:diadenosine tetraphosphate (Ap4A) HIT family hydrolase|nr:putative 13 [Rickettsiales bacterium]
MTYDRDNIFARIIRGEIPCDPVYQDESVLALRDIAPAAPVHVLVLPKGAYTSFNDFVVSAGAEAVGEFFATVQHIATEIVGLEETGYRLIMNHGKHASQTVPHFHVHILGGKPLGGLLESDVLAR